MKGKKIFILTQSSLTELTPHPGVKRTGQRGSSVAGGLLWGLLWAPWLRWLLRLLVGCCHHLLVMGRTLITLLLTHVVVHEVILCRGLVIVLGMVLVIRLHVMLRRSLLMVRMLLLRMVMILMIMVIERCLWGAF